MSNLFSEPFFNLEEEIKRLCLDKIKNTPKSTFLSNREQKLIDYFYEEFKVDGLDVSKEYIEENDTQNEITLCIPLKKGVNLFKYRPQTSPMFWFSIRLPILDSQNIIHRINFNSQTNSEQINRECKHVVTTIKNNVGNLNSDIAKFNIQLKKIITDNIKAKLEDIKKSSGIIGNLNIKLKRRGDVPKTYLAPIRRKKISFITHNIETENPFNLEPTLSDQTYEEILNIIDNMSLVMERSPSAFINMKEEDLRIHFLVQLNGQFEGEAIGEVFNLIGKTDILIRHKGKNIFIAECKFWHGKKGLLESVDQLLKYISWRDTKTSIILFNKNKDTSKVLEQIPKILEKHKNYIKKLEYDKEASFRFLMKNKNDEDKRFILTIKVYDVPQN